MARALQGLRTLPLCHAPPTRRTEGAQAAKRSGTRAQRVSYLRSTRQISGVVKRSALQALAITDMKLDAQFSFVAHRVNGRSGVNRIPGVPLSALIGHSHPVR